jgi:hypothetical protein
VDTAKLEPNSVDAVIVDAVIAFPTIVENWITLVEIALVFILEVVVVEFTVIVDAVIAFPTIVENWITLVEIALVFILEVVAVEFTVIVDAVIAFPTIVENRITLVEIELVDVVDSVPVEYTINVLVFKLLPDIFINPISTAVNWPLVFDVKVLMVEPVAVEKNKFCATKLFATYISWLTLIIGVEILMIVDALTYNVLLLIVDGLMVLTLI